MLEAVENADEAVVNWQDETVVHDHTVRNIRVVLLDFQVVDGRSAF